MLPYQELYTRNKKWYQNNVNPKEIDNERDYCIMQKISCWQDYITPFALRWSCFLIAYLLRECKSPFLHSCRFYVQFYSQFIYNLGVMCAVCLYCLLAIVFIIPVPHHMCAYDNKPDSIHHARNLLSILLWLHSSPQPKGISMITSSRWSKT